MNPHALGNIDHPADAENTPASDRHHNVAHHRIAEAKVLRDEANIDCVEESSLSYTMVLHVELESGSHDVAHHHAGEDEMHPCVMHCA